MSNDKGQLHEKNVSENVDFCYYIFQALSKYILIIAMKGFHM